MYLLSILYILLNEFASGFLEMLVSVFIGNIGQSFFVVLFVSGFGIRESYQPQKKHLGSLPVTFSGTVRLQFMLFLPSVFGKTHQCSHVVLFVGRLLSMHSVSLVFCRTIQGMYFFVSFFFFLSFWQLQQFVSFKIFISLSCQTYEHKIVNNIPLFYCCRVCNEVPFLFLILVIRVLFLGLSGQSFNNFDLFKIPAFVFIYILSFLFD